jgi:biotin synthase
MNAIRHNWTLEEIRSLYRQPLFDLLHQSSSLHRHHQDPKKIQVCHLISVKTGGCPEDCKYCAQSSRYQTPVSPQAMLSFDEVLTRAKAAKEWGASRICLGAAWREVRSNKPFEELLKMIKAISDLGMEVCCTFGMLKEEQAQKLTQAGIHSYNHNLDTSANYYSQIVTTRTYEERLKTLDVVQKTGIKVCCGGILGLGESIEDRLSFLHTLAIRNRHPDSVPINLLSPVPGTPLQNNTRIPFWEFLRIVALARILMPKSFVRLSAGRIQLSLSEQALCFLAGANSIHVGEKLLTVGNPEFDADEAMLSLFGLEKIPPYQKADEV